MLSGRLKIKANYATATAIVGVLGLSIWGQISLSGLIWDFGHAAATPWRAALFVMPLLLLIPGLATRSLLMLLLLFPLALMPSVALLSPAELIEIVRPWAALRILGTFAVYQALVSAWLADPVEMTEVESGTSTIGRSYSRFVAGRVGPMLLLFIVPTYAVFFDAPIAATIAQNSPGNEAAAQTFIGVVMFFVWAVCTYTLFLVPALNLEYDRRRVRREYEAITDDFASGRRWIRLGIEATVVCVGMTAFALAFWR